MNYNIFPVTPSSTLHQAAREYQRKSTLSWKICDHGGGERNGSVFVNSIYRVKGENVRDIFYKGKL